MGELSLHAIFACDSLIVPISADHLSAKGAMQVEKTLKALEPVLKRRIKRRYLLTRFDGRRGMAWEVLKMVEDRFGEEVCRTRIAENVSLAESPAYNKTVFEHAPGSRGAHDYDEQNKKQQTNNKNKHHTTQHKKKQKHIDRMAARRLVAFAVPD